ncbi:carbon storage regulator CsrA [Anaerosalibacter massiliensis]|uniref:Translational regulator CsrA n=1 Tax=Anaerosalibacter massiliensis TaxID=1347392 RepID=A0A9X2MJD6_9FIRM|nr:carbon storage regulator CsrA [Anaerosalibacter massiliensis]MCR2044734.1 carbon storage regulator CsrA [Anaerosalibacter massiliensis]
MLILTRKKDESIIIGDNVEIKVLEISDGKVKLGIEAPKNIDIIRKELYENIEKENKKASEIHISLDELKEIMSKGKKD